MKRYKLKLTSLKFVSSVDVPAQETATALLLKRGPSAPAPVKATAKVLKTSDELGIVFGWALTTKVAGIDYYDLHGDNITEDGLIKVAAEWMAGGGAADTMHDRVKDGGAMFVMPMTYEVAKAFFGDKFDAAIGTYGLMVALKPSAEDFAKFKTGELAGFSIDGMGLREEAETTKTVGKVQKAALYTDTVDGHAHKICIYDDGSLYVDYATMAGAESSHSHGIIRDDTGKLTILADSGHEHMLAEGQPSLIVVGVDDIVVVAARAAHAKSTRPIATPKVESMDPIVLTEAQFAHYQKLSPADQKAFIAKSAVDRDGDIAKALNADPVIFKGEKTGIEVRKSQGEFAHKIAKQAEESAVTMAKQAEEISKRDTEIKKARIRKVAAEILGAKAPGDDATHDFIIEQIEGNEKAMAALKGLVECSKLGKKAPGVGGSESPENSEPVEKLRARVQKFQADHQLPTYEQAFNRALREDPETASLYAATRN